MKLKFSCILMAGLFLLNTACDPPSKVTPLPNQPGEPGQEAAEVSGQQEGLSQQEAAASPSDESSQAEVPQQGQSPQQEAAVSQSDEPSQKVAEVSGQQGQSAQQEAAAPQSDESGQAEASGQQGQSAQREAAASFSISDRWLAELKDTSKLLSIPPYIQDQDLTFEELKNEQKRKMALLKEQHERFKRDIRLAEMGDADAQFRLAGHYGRCRFTDYCLDSLSNQERIQKMMENLKSAAEQGHAEAREQYMMFLRMGVGVTDNNNTIAKMKIIEEKYGEDIIRLIFKGVNDGNIREQIELAKLYRDNQYQETIGRFIHSGNEYKRDEEAIYWAKKAVNNERSEARTLLPEAYNVLGTLYIEQGNYAKAFEVLEKAPKHHQKLNVMALRWSKKQLTTMAILRQLADEGYSEAQSLLEDHFPYRDKYDNQKVAEKLFQSGSYGRQKELFRLAFEASDQPEAFDELYKRHREDIDDKNILKFVAKNLGLEVVTIEEEKAARLSQKEKTPIHDLSETEENRRILEFAHFLDFLDQSTDEGKIKDKYLIDKIFPDRDVFDRDNQKYAKEFLLKGAGRHKKEIILSILQAVNSDSPNESFNQLSEKYAEDEDVTRLIDYMASSSYHGLELAEAESLGVTTEEEKPILSQEEVNRKILEFVHFLDFLDQSGDEGNFEVAYLAGKIFTSKELFENDQTYAEAILKSDGEEDYKKEIRVIVLSILQAVSSDNPNESFNQLSEEYADNEDVTRLINYVASSSYHGLELTEAE